MELSIPGLILINGPSCIGKSHLIKYIMSINHKKFSYGLVFSNTSFDISDKSSFDYVPSKFVHSDFDETILESFMDLQANLIKQGIIKETYLILDDCLDRDMFNKKSFNRLVTQGRHYHITTFLSTQYPNAITPKTRSNCFQVVIFYTDTNVALKALWESFGQMYEFKEFKNLIMTNCKNHAFLYYNKKEQDANKRYQVFRAPSKIKKFEVEFKTSIKL